MTIELIVVGTRVVKNTEQNPLSHSHSVQLVVPCLETASIQLVGESGRYMFRSISF